MATRRALRQTPSWVRIDRDPVSYVALRDRRLPRSSFDVGSVAHAHRLLAVTAPIVVEALGAGVLRKYLWRAFRWTVVADECEAAGLSTVPEIHRMLSVGEIAGKAGAEGVTASISGLNYEAMGFLAERPRCRWMFTREDEARAVAQCADFSLMGKPDEWKQKLYGEKYIGHGSQPCHMPFVLVCNLVAMIASAHSWEMETSATHTVMAALAYAQVTVDAATVDSCVAERFDRMHGPWMRGEPIDPRQEWDMPIAADVRQGNLL